MEFGAESKAEKYALFEAMLSKNHYQRQGLPHLTPYTDAHLSIGIEGRARARLPDAAQNSYNSKYETGSGVPRRRGKPGRRNNTVGDAAAMGLQIIEKLEAEIRQLDYELHNELPKEIQKARELGDLSENAEYSAAKERQRLVSSRMAQLTERLAKLKMIDLSKIPNDAAGLGSTVVVYDVGEDREITYELVTSEEADAPAGKISTTSPIGRSLMGKRDGDVAEARTPGGIKEFEILSLLTIHDRE